jgi:adenylate kinase family enzyme
MRRIAIVGISGAGKSTYGRALHELTGLPLSHMDRLFWRGKWEAVPEADYAAAHRALVSDEEWIIEGYIDPTLAGRARAADLIVYLDFSGVRCTLRVLLRWLRHRRRARAELPPEAVERISLSYLWIVLTRAERRAIEESLRDIQRAKVLRARSPSQLARLTQAIKR